MLKPCLTVSNQPLKGERAPRGLSFVTKSKDCSSSWRAVNVVAQPPNYLTETSYFDVNKSCSFTLFGTSLYGSFNILLHFFVLHCRKVGV